MRRLIPALALLLLAGGCGSDEPGSLFADDGSEAVADYSFTIPAGTGELIDSGESVDILPQALDVKVGEVLELVNLDDRGHLVGPFFVGFQAVMGPSVFRQDIMNQPESQQTASEAGFEPQISVM